MWGAELSVGEVAGGRTCDYRYMMRCKEPARGTARSKTPCCNGCFPHYRCLLHRWPRLPTVQVAGSYGPRASAEEVDERSDAEGDGCQQGEQEFESGADADRLE